MRFQQSQTKTYSISFSHAEGRSDCDSNQIQCSAKEQFKIKTIEHYSELAFLLPKVNSRGSVPLGSGVPLSPFPKDSCRPFLLYTLYGTTLNAQKRFFFCTVTGYNCYHFLVEFIPLFRDISILLYVLPSNITTLCCLHQ
jgi:hypothetical protein